MCFDPEMTPIHAATDCAGEVAAAIERRGVVQLKGAIPPRDMLALSADAVDYFLWRKLPAGNASILCAVPDAALGKVVDINATLVRSICLGPAGAVAREYFRRTCGVEDFIVPARGVYARVIAAQLQPLGPQQCYQVLPYHQDAYAFPPGWSMVNSWTLLYPDRAGEEAAGLEFIASGVNELMEHEASPTHPVMGWIESSHARIDDLQSRHGSWVPEIELGDAMLFHQFTPHRTYFSKPSKPRIAAEIRMIPKEPKVLEEYARNGIPYFSVTAGTMTGPKRARIDTPVEVLVGEA
jgi:hypothetical protein